MPSDYDSEVATRSTVWSRHPVASYLSYSSPDSVSRGRSLPPSDTDSTASDIDKPDLLGDGGEVGGIDQPSLGYLEEALGFIAAERAKFVAQLDVGMRGNHSSATTTTSDSVWRHVIQPRRKRRRKKVRSVLEVSRVRVVDRDHEVLTESTTVDATAPDDDGADADDAYDSSSSVDVTSSPQVQPKVATPARNKQEKRRPETLAVSEKPRLQHSKSTPNLISLVSIPLDARVLHLRNLAHKLRLFFPQDAVALRTILSPESESAVTEGFVDTRGPVPRSQDALIHVFIDQCVVTYFRVLTPANIPPAPIS